MEFTIRPVDIAKDREKLLEFHHSASYESADQYFLKTYTFEQSHKLWLKGSGPNEFLAELEKSLKDPRSISDIWEHGGEIAAYVWVTFTDWPGFNATSAHIEDMLVTPRFRRQGLGTQVIKHVEKLVRDRGAIVLRSGTGVLNIASRRLHEKVGFYTERLEFQKEL